MRALVGLLLSCSVAQSDFTGRLFADTYDLTGSSNSFIAISPGSGDSKQIGPYPRSTDAVRESLHCDCSSTALLSLARSLRRDGFSVLTKLCCCLQIDGAYDEISGLYALLLSDVAGNLRLDYANASSGAVVGSTATSLPSLANIECSYLFVASSTLR
jgi:hypothetical protein